MDRFSRRSGLGLAALTALISGVAIFLNGYGVRAWAEVSDATTYTTLKNGLAALVVVVVGSSLSRRGSTPTWAGLAWRQRWLLVGIALVGGSIPFVLFFEGLARAESVQAAFIHKTLVVWVAVLAPLLLKERIRGRHLVAIGLLMWGQAALVNEFGAISIGPGERMIMLATLLWSVEVVVAKRLLAEVTPTLVCKARMLGGSLLLVAFSLLRGVEINLSALTGDHLLWIVVTGGSLAAYVLTWFVALSRAPALDVTAILVGGAVITALLQAGVGGAALPSPLGLGLVAAGTGLILISAWKRATTTA